jgi:hypothetical protein
MGLLTCILSPRGLTHGRPPYSSLPSPGDVVPMVPNLINLDQPDLLILGKLSSALFDLEQLIECILALAK